VDIPGPVCSRLLYRWTNAPGIGSVMNLYIRENLRWGKGELIHKTFDLYCFIMCVFLLRFEAEFLVSLTGLTLKSLRFTNVLKPLEAKDMSTLFEFYFSARGSKRRRLFLKRIDLVIVLFLCRRRMKSFDTGNYPGVCLWNFSRASLGLPQRPVIVFLHDEAT
jgi:hypothetical protein